MLFHELLFFFSEQQKLQQFQFSIFDMHSFCQKKGWAYFHSQEVNE